MSVIPLEDADLIFGDLRGGAIRRHGLWYPFQYTKDLDIQLLSKTGRPRKEDAFKDYKELYK